MSVDLQAWVGGWTVSAGSGDTITGVVDSSGAPFTPRLFVFQGNTVLNTLQTPSRNSSGFDDLTTRLSQGSEDSTFAGLKLANTAISGQYSLIDEAATFFFGGVIQRLGYVSSVGSGTFDVTYDTHLRSGDYVSCLVLGGSALEWKIGQINAGAIATAFEPLGMLTRGQGLFSASNSTSGVGGAAWGVAASDPFFEGAMVALNGDPSPIARYQRPDRIMASLTGSTLVDARQVTFGASSVTFNGGGSAPHAYLALGGTGVKIAAGSETQPPATGLQTYDCGIAGKALLVMSFGGIGIASGDVQTDAFLLSFGLADGTRQAAYWTGEATNGDSGSLSGARYVSDVDTLLFATPNGGSTTFANKAQFVAFDTEAGTFSLQWSDTDGVLREWYWWVIGEETSTPVPPPPPNVSCLDLTTIATCPSTDTPTGAIFICAADSPVRSARVCDSDNGVGMAANDQTIAPLCGDLN